MLKSGYILSFLVFALIGCSQDKKVNTRCKHSSCEEGALATGANATFSPFKFPNAPEGPWTIKLEESPVPDPKTGLKKLKVSWAPYPNAKKYQLMIALDNTCTNPLKAYDNIIGIFYDQDYSRELLIDNGIKIFICLKAFLPDNATASPENSPLTVGAESERKLSFRLLPPLPSMHSGPVKIQWTELKGAISYDISLTDSKGKIIQTIANIKNAGLLNSYEISGLPQGRYFLRVLGNDPSGMKIKALTDKKDAPYEFLVSQEPVGAWNFLKAANPAPSGRTDAAFVYTPQGIILWGGSTSDGIAQDGAIYNPSTNQWTPMSVLNSPEPRLGPFAWTGSQLVIWGGSNFDNSSLKATQNLGNGSAYDPLKNQWVPLATAGAPAARQAHTLTAMEHSVFVWGGIDQLSIGDKSARTFNDGGIYDTITQRWTPVMSTSGISRAYHCSVWTGTVMLIWGGAEKKPDHELALLTHGEIFDPKTQQWRAMNNVGQPAARYAHNCVWTGKKMLVWGGSVQFFAVSNGAAYDPGTDSWSPIDDVNSPLATIGEASYWSGKYLMVWGGREGESNLVQVGGLYDPESNKWQFTTLQGAPSPRWGVSLSGTGEKVYFFGGDSIQKTSPGKVYDELVEFTFPP